MKQGISRVACYSAPMKLGRTPPGLPRYGVPEVHIMIMSPSKAWVPHSQAVKSALIYTLMGEIPIEALFQSQDPLVL